MTRTIHLRLLFWAGLATISAGLTCCNSPALAADRNPTPNATEKSKVPKGRLPAHYAKVVTQQHAKKFTVFKKNTGRKSMPPAPN